MSQLKDKPNNSPSNSWPPASGDDKNVETSKSVRIAYRNKWTETANYSSVSEKSVERRTHNVSSVTSSQTGTESMHSASSEHTDNAVSGSFTLNESSQEARRKKLEAMKSKIQISFSEIHCAKPVLTVTPFNYPSSEASYISTDSGSSSHLQPQAQPQQGSSPVEPSSSAGVLIQPSAVAKMADAVTKSRVEITGKESQYSVSAPDGKIKNNCSGSYEMHRQKHANKLGGRRSMYRDHSRNLNKTVQKTKASRSTLHNVDTLPMKKQIDDDEWSIGSSLEDLEDLINRDIIENNADTDLRVALNRKERVQHVQCKKNKPKNISQRCYEPDSSYSIGSNRMCKSKAYKCGSSSKHTYSVATNMQPGTTLSDDANTHMNSTMSTKLSTYEAESLSVAKLKYYKASCSYVGSSENIQVGRKPSYTSQNYEDNFHSSDTRYGEKHYSKSASCFYDQRERSRTYSMEKDGGRSRSPSFISGSSSSEKHDRKSRSRSRGRISEHNSRSRSVNRQLKRSRSKSCERWIEKISVRSLKRNRSRSTSTDRQSRSRSRSISTSWQTSRSKSKSVRSYRRSRSISADRHIQRSRSRSEDRQMLTKSKNYHNKKQYRRNNSWKSQRGNQSFTLRGRRGAWKKAPAKSQSYSLVNSRLSEDLDTSNREVVEAVEQTKSPSYSLVNSRISEDRNTSNRKGVEIADDQPPSVTLAAVTDTSSESEEELTESEKLELTIMNSTSSILKYLVQKSTSSTEPTQPKNLASAVETCKKKEQPCIAKEREVEKDISSRNKFKKSVQSTGLAYEIIRKNTEHTYVEQDQELSKIFGGNAQDCISSTFTEVSSRSPHSSKVHMHDKNILRRKGGKGNNAFQGTTPGAHSSHQTVESSRGELAASHQAAENRRGKVASHQTAKYKKEKKLSEETIKERIAAIRKSMENYNDHITKPNTKTIRNKIINVTNVSHVAHVEKNESGHDCKMPSFSRDIPKASTEEEQTRHDIMASETCSQSICVSGLKGNMGELCVQGQGVENYHSSDTEPIPSDSESVENLVKTPDFLSENESEKSEHLAEDQASETPEHSAEEDECDAPEHSLDTNVQDTDHEQIEEETDADLPDLVGDPSVWAKISEHRTVSCQSSVSDKITESNDPVSSLTMGHSLEASRIGRKEKEALKLVQPNVGSVKPVDVHRKNSSPGNLIPAEKCKTVDRKTSRKTHVPNMSAKESNVKRKYNKTLEVRSVQRSHKERMAKSRMENMSTEYKAGCIAQKSSKTNTKTRNIKSSTGCTSHRLQKDNTDSKVDKISSTHRSVKSTDEGNLTNFCESACVNTDSETSSSRTKVNSRKEHSKNLVEKQNKPGRKGMTEKSNSKSKGRRKNTDNSVTYRNIDTSGRQEMSCSNKNRVELQEISSKESTNLKSASLFTNECPTCHHSLIADQFTTVNLATGMITMRCHNCFKYTSMLGKETSDKHSKPSSKQKDDSFPENTLKKGLLKKQSPEYKLDSVGSKNVFSHDCKDPEDEMKSHKLSVTRESNLSTEKGKTKRKKQVNQSSVKKVVEDEENKLVNQSYNSQDQLIKGQTMLQRLVSDLNFGDSEKQVTKGKPACKQQKLKYRKIVIMTSDEDDDEEEMSQTCGSVKVCSGEKRGIAAPNHHDKR